MAAIENVFYCRPQLPVLLTSISDGRHMKCWIIILLTTPISRAPQQCFWSPKPRLKLFSGLLILCQRLLKTFALEGRRNF